MAPWQPPQMPQGWVPPPGAWRPPWMAQQPAPQQQAPAAQPTPVNAAPQMQAQRAAGGRLHYDVGGGLPYGSGGTFPYSGGRGGYVPYQAGPSQWGRGGLAAMAGSSGNPENNDKSTMGGGGI